MNFLAAGGVEAPLDVTGLLAVLIVAWGAGRVAERIGMPSVLGELMAGIIVGPALLGFIGPTAGLEVLGEFGVLLMMLVIGMHVDIDDIVKARKAGFLAATGGFIVPAALGTGVLLAFDQTPLAALFVGLSLAVTSLATKSRILADLDLFGTRIANVLVAGALLSDTAMLIAFAAIMGFFNVGSFDVAGTSRVAIEVVGFLAIAIALGRYALPRVAERINQSPSTSVTTMLAVIVGIGLGFGALADAAGLHGLLGTFIAGLFLRAAGFEGIAWDEAVDAVEGTTMRILAPVFFVQAGFAISFAAIATAPWMLVAVLLAASIGKIVGTALFYLPTGHGWREGLVVGAGMNGRGAVEIIVAGIGLEAGVIDATLFTVLVFTAIATTATVPILLRIGVAWLRRVGDLPEQAERNGAVIVGSGPVARLLAKELSEDRDVTVIDSNERRLARAAAQGIRTVRGDALDIEILDDANAGTAGLLIALTANPEVNVLSAQLAAEQFRVEHVAGALGNDPGGLRTLAERRGVLPLMDIPIDVEEWDRRLATRKTQAVWHVLTSEADIERADAGDLGFALLVRRGEQRLLYTSARPLVAGDELLVLEHEDAVQVGSDPSTAQQV